MFMIMLRIISKKGLSIINNLEIRKKNVEIALAYNSLDKREPSKYCLKLLNDYIDGWIDPEEITNLLVRRYSVT